MKKFLALSLAIVLVSVAFAGCSKDEAKAEIEKFEGEIATVWTDVEDEFIKMEENAETSIKNMIKMDRDDLKEATAVIEEAYGELKDGVTKDTEKYAKAMYKAGHKLEVMGEKYTGIADHEIVKLGMDAKAYVKHLYGEAEVDYSKVKTDVEKGLKNVKGYSEEEWSKVEDLFA